MFNALSTSFDNSLTDGSNSWWGAAGYNMQEAIAQQNRLTDALAALSGYGTRNPDAQDTETAQSIQQMPGAVSRSIRELIGSMHVVLDGASVGRVLTGQIARQWYQETQ